MQRREVRNALAFFIPGGEVVDTVTVSRTTWPDNAPTTNYTAYEIPDIEGITEAIATEKEDFLRRRASGGWGNEPETHLRGLSWTITTTKTSSLIKQLQMALTAAAVSGTAQAPGTKAAVYIDGVYLMEIGGNAGAIIERTQVWARISLTDPGATAAPQTAKMQILVEMLESGLNTYVPLGS